VRVHSVQQALLRPHSPLEKTPHKAGVVSDAGESALAAFFDMAAESGGAADFDGAHDAQLLKRQFMRRPEGFTVLSKNAGQLESGPAHVYLFDWSGFLAAVFCSGKTPSRSSGLRVPATI